MLLSLETLDRGSAVALHEGADASAADAWDEDLWDDLLAYIEAGRVVPIIGPACYPVEIDGRTTSLDRHVAERLARKLRIAATPPGETLNEVVLAYLHADGDRRRLYRFVNEIVQEMELAPPPMLKQLAEIGQFNLFVTTGFDTLLEVALDQVRFGGVPQTRSIAYAPNNKQDLPQGIEDGSPTVYHLFGKVSALPNSYAISDEDLLEFLTALQSDARRPENLFNRLKSEHVLLIGAHFPDWVARMFLRTTKGRRLSESRDELEFLFEESASREPSLVAFLKHFSKPTRLFDGDLDLGQFVETLWRRWRERRQPATATGRDRWAPRAAEMPADAIFISYTREDLVAVRALTDALEAAGLSVWFDMNRLTAGESFDLKIEQNIRRCSLFIPVLSRNTEARAQGYFRREWHYALDRDKEIDPNRPFIVPVAIDDTVDIGRLPRPFREINIAGAPDGQPSAELIAHLKMITGRSP